MKNIFLFFYKFRFYKNFSHKKLRTLMIDLSRFCDSHVPSFSCNVSGLNKTFLHLKLSHYNQCVCENLWSLKMETTKIFIFIRPAKIQKTRMCFHEFFRQALTLFFPISDIVIFCFRLKFKNKTECQKITWKRWDFYFEIWRTWGGNWSKTSLNFSGWVWYVP